MSILHVSTEFYNLVCDFAQTLTHSAVWKYGHQAHVSISVGGKLGELDVIKLLGRQ